jgi:hypothetical protein
VRTLAHREGESSSPPPVDLALSALAQTQHGLATTSQLLAAGLSYNGISRRAKRGLLRRRHLGVYSIGPGPLTRDAEMLAVVLAGGGGAVLDQLAGAELWQAWRYRAPLSILVPSRRTVRGVEVHRCANLDPRDVTVHRGIPVTSFARTLVDLTDALIAEELTNVIHEGAFRRRFSIPDTRAAMARANGRRRLARLEEAIELWLAGSAGIKSRLERAFIDLVVEAGLPKPIPNIHVAGAQVDGFRPDAGLVVEVDGPNHLRPPSLVADRSRDRLLAETGVTVLRFTEFEIERRPEAVAAVLYPRLKALKAERLVPSSSIRPDSTCLLSGRDSSS